MGAVERRDVILKYVDTSKKGIEIAPYFNPTIAKRDGHDVLILDVFDTERLRALAKNDPLIPNERLHEIEEVDIVCDASNIGDILTQKGLAGQIHHIVSSHNFEHLPNPILFLQGVEKVLAPGGILSMAVPDYRACFDHFRMPTRLSDWLSAFHRGVRQPSPETIFDNASNAAHYYRDEKPESGCSLGVDDPSLFRPAERLKEAYAEYMRGCAEPGDYRDAHCSVFFPQTLDLMINDLRFIGLIGLEVEEITLTHGHEFFVHLRRCVTSTPMDERAFYVRRHALMAEISNLLGAAPYNQCSDKTKILLAPKGTVSRVIENALGKSTYMLLRRWNRRRKDAIRARKKCNT